jgi:hypothetical protein
MALMFGVMVASFVFVLCMTLLTIAERDAQFTLLQEAQGKAFAAAMGGLTYWKITSEEHTVGTVGPFDIPDDSFKVQFKVDIQPTGDIIATGMVTRPGMSGPMATHSVMYKSGDYSRYYDGP